MKSNAGNNQGLKRKPPMKYFDVRTGLQIKPSAALKKRVAAARRKSK
jgi:hypothetical protein